MPHLSVCIYRKQIVWPLEIYIINKKNLQILLTKNISYLFYIEYNMYKQFLNIKIYNKKSEFLQHVPNMFRLLAAPSSNCCLFIFLISHGLTLHRSGKNGLGREWGFEDLELNELEVRSWSWGSEGEEMKIRSLRWGDGDEEQTLRRWRWGAECEKLKMSS